VGRGSAPWHADGSAEAVNGLPDWDVARTRPAAKRIHSQWSKKEDVDTTPGTPTRPTCGEDDSITEPFDNPHPHRESELLAKLEATDRVPSDLNACLRHGRTLPSLRVATADPDRYGCTEGCPRCFNTQVGGTQYNCKRWDACRRSAYQEVYHADGSEIHSRLRGQPTDTAKVGPSVGLSASPAWANSSTFPSRTSSPGSREPLPVPGHLQVFGDAAV